MQEQQDGGGGEQPKKEGSPEQKKQKKTRRKSNEQRKVLFSEDVARMIGCSAATVERMRYEGRGPKWIRVGRKNIVYREEAVLAWLEQEEQGGER